MTPLDLEKLDALYAKATPDTGTPMDGLAFAHEIHNAYPALRERIRALEARLERETFSGLSRRAYDADLVARACTCAGDGSDAYYVFNGVLHGRFKGTLTDEQREKLRAHIELFNP